MLSLWRYGTAKAVAVPGSGATCFVAITPGPDGRLGIAWYRTSTNTLCTVRTNKAANMWSARQRYPLPTSRSRHSPLAVAPSGASTSCSVVRTTPTCALESTTQSLTALALSASATINNKASHKISFATTDAGDPVAGAAVIVDGKKLHMNVVGTVTVTFAKGTSPGHRVSAWKRHDFPGEREGSTSRAERAGRRQVKDAGTPIAPPTTSAATTSAITLYVELFCASPSATHLLTPAQPRVNSWLSCTSVHLLFTRTMFSGSITVSRRQQRRHYVAVAKAHGYRTASARGTPRPAA